VIVCGGVSSTWARHHRHHRHHQADAREASKEPGHSSDEKDENEDVRGEVKLVQLLRLGGLVRHPYASWLPRLLAVLVRSPLFSFHFFSFLFLIFVFAQESGKTPDVLKVALIEHLGLDSVTPNSTKIVTFLLEDVVKRATTSDKVRACAVFAVGYLLYRNTTGNERLRTTWADFFYKPTAGTSHTSLFLMRLCVCVCVCV
jgi:hypothetical protein